MTTVDKLVPALDAWSDAWRIARQEMCVAAQIDRTMPDDRFDRARNCLDERKDALEALVSTLAEGGPEAVVRAIPAVASLPSIALCSDSQWLANASALPRDEDTRALTAEVRRELARAVALDLAGRYAESVALGDGLIARADAVEMPSLGATARLQLARALDRAGDPNRARSLLESALHIAVRAGEERLAAEIATSLAQVVGVSLARHDEGLAWARLAEDWIEHLGESDGMLGASLWARIGSIHQERADYPASRDANLRALMLRERWLGPDHPEIAAALNNLALAEGGLGDWRSAIEHERRAVALWEATLGPSHPMVALGLTNLARTLQALGEWDAARADLDRALAIRIAAVGPAHPDTAYTLLNRCNLDLEQKSDESAREDCTRALAILERALGLEHPDVALVLQNLAALEPQPGEPGPRALLERALRIREGGLGPDHPAVADTHRQLGELHLKARELDSAAREFELARDGMERAFGADSADLVPILLGLGRVELARHHEMSGRAALQRASEIVKARGLTDHDAEAVGVELARATPNR